jgi:hypothetical protein
VKTEWTKRQKAEDRRQKAEGRGQRAEGIKQKRLDKNNIRFKNFYYAGILKYKILIYFITSSLYTYDLPLTTYHLRLTTIYDIYGKRK